MTINIFTTDTNLIIRSWDLGLTRMTGLSQEYVCGKELTEIIPDLEARKLKETFEKVIREGVREILPHQKVRYLIPCPPQFHSKKFEMMQQKVTISPLQDHEKILGIIVTIEDITSQLEEEIEVQEILNPPLTSSPDILKQNEPPKLKSIQELIPNLTHKDWKVRQQAVAQLKEYRAPEITQELVRLMRQYHRNTGLLNAILQIFADSIIDPIPALIECLKEEDRDLRIYTVLALGERRDSRAIKPLIKMLDDPDTNVRFHTIEALGRLKATEAIEKLIAIAQSEDFYLGFAALDTLMAMGESGITPPLIPLIQNTLDWRVRQEAIDSLAMQKDQGLMKDLIGLFRRHHRNPTILNSVLQIFSISDLDCLPFLQECLKDTDPDLRTYAALAMGERQDERAIPYLIKALEDSETNVRYHSIEALGYLRAVEAVPPLISQAQSGDFFIVFPALEALVRISMSAQGKKQAPTIAVALIPLLEDELFSVQVIELMGKLGDAQVVPSLAEKFDKLPSCVEPVAKALASIYQRYEETQGEGKIIVDLTCKTISPQGVNNLLEGLKKVQSENLSSLVFVLGCLKGREVEESLSQLLEQPRVRSKVVDILVTYGHRVCDLLLTQLESPYLETRKAAIIALGRIGSTQSVEALTNLLNTEHPELVMVTTSALAKIGDNRAFESLLSLLGHKDSSVRLGAISALNSLGHPAMPHRISTLMEDSDENVRESAVKIAGYFAYPQCIDTLLQRTMDKSERVRRVAIENLVYLENDRVLPILATALSQDTPQVRAAAATGLGELDNLQVLAPLIDALGDEDTWVRYHSLGAIAKLAESQIKDDLDSQLYLSLKRKLLELTTSDPANHVRAVSTEVLGIIAKEEVIDLLTKLTENEDEDQARAALRALGKIRHPSAIAPLLAALNSPNSERRLDAIQAFRDQNSRDAEVTLQWMAKADPEERVAEAAIESLARIGTPEAISALLELSIDPKNRELCISCLVLHSKSSKLFKINYIEAIAEGLNHTEPAIRGNVVEILKRFKHPLASEYLITALNDQDDSVRLAAVNALVSLGNRSCQEQLRLLARTDPLPTIRRLAQKGLYSG